MDTTRMGSVTVALAHRFTEQMRQPDLATRANSCTHSDSNKVDQSINIEIRYDKCDRMHADEPRTTLLIRCASSYTLTPDIPHSHSLT